MLTAVLVGLVTSVPEYVPAEGIPYFARRYGLSCRSCHIQPPVLNEMGERFRQQGYRMTGLVSRGTMPLAIWASARSDHFPDESQVGRDIRAYVNKLEVISGGRIVAPWLSYFVEWRPVSQEPVRRNGVMQLRDRAGRFEDAFLTAAVGNLALTVGQFRQIDQVDVSLRPGLSEPLPLATPLLGTGDGTARLRSLRGFAPAGRSPSVRIAWRQPMGDRWDWTMSAALPVPGEFSLPLTREARVEASAEIEWEPKGVVLESYLRRGLVSVGAHSFYDHGDRYLIHGVTTGRSASLLWTGVAGVERQGGVLRGRWSVEAAVAPHYFALLGGRVEDRAGDDSPLAILPYVRVHFPGTRFTAYLAVEQRIQRNRHATQVELGTVF